MVMRLFGFRKRRRKQRNEDKNGLRGYNEGECLVNARNRGRKEENNARIVDLRLCAEDEGEW